MLAPSICIFQIAYDCQAKSDMFSVRTFQLQHCVMFDSSLSIFSHTVHQWGYKHLAGVTQPNENLKL